MKHALALIEQAMKRMFDGITPKATYERPSVPSGLVPTQSNSSARKTLCGLRAPWNCPDASQRATGIGGRVSMIQDAMAG